MKTKDLMIGDYVTFKDCQNNEAPTIVKIEGLGYQERGGAEEAIVSIDGDAAFDLVEINEEFVGIPLTPEILKTNGFEKRNRYQWIYRDNSCTIKISIAPKIKIKGELLGPPPIDVAIEGALFVLNKTDEWCVHELQHALKLCGIEKEITL